MTTFASRPRALGRIAGLFYLVLVVAGGFAHLFARAEVHIDGDASATAANIAANPDLFRLGFAADIVAAIAFVSLGLALYRMFQNTDRRSAGALVIFVCVGASMMLSNLVLHMAALLVATDASYESAFGEDGADALVLLALDLHAHGYAVAGVFFGLWLLPLGYLAVKSGYFPRLLGVLLMAAGVSYLVKTVLPYLAPDLPEIVYTIVGIPTFAELLTVLYLLIIGAKRPRAQASPPAA